MGPIEHGDGAGSHGIADTLGRRRNRYILVAIAVKVAVGHGAAEVIVGVGGIGDAVLSLAPEFVAKWG